MIKVENIYTEIFDDADLTLLRGWNDAIAEELVELSKEEEIRKFTPRDETDRFPSVEAANKWFKAKEHIVYVLKHKDGMIGGLMWFSYEPREELQSDYTIGIRMYGSLRGKGLAGSFMEACHADFRFESGYAGGIWLTTDADNERARHVYMQHGYMVRDEHDGRVSLVRVAR